MSKTISGDLLTKAESLVSAALKAGIRVPEKLDDFNKQVYPYWALFCAVQLDRMLPQPDAHYRNAETIAKISPRKIRKTTIADIRDQIL